MTARCVIDTDPGIDDAIAILFALRDPGLDVAALTSVGGNIGLEATTRNAGRVAALAGAAVPVHPGAAGTGEDAGAIHGADGLGGVAFPEAAPPSGEDAVTAMARLLRDAPEGTVWLHCLGPLTNLAALLDAEPRAAARLAGVVAMGGAVDGPGNVRGGRAEFNLAHDARAAARVLGAGLALTLIPLDATRQVRAGTGFVDGLRGRGAVADAVAGLIAAYFDGTAHQAAGSESRPLHDPCVPLLATRPGLFRVEERGLAVDHEGALAPGPHRVRVAMGADGPAALAVLRAGLVA